MIEKIWSFLQYMHDVFILLCYVVHLRNCGGMGSGTCAVSESILFGWARDAPALQLPKGLMIRKS